MNDLLSFPSLIDCHVHFREPGLEYKGDMQSESLAARTGGVMTVCDMPNTLPPTVTVHALRDKVTRAQRVQGCDVHCFFGVTDIAHIGELRLLWSEEEYREVRERCCGVKLYLDHSTGNQGIPLKLIPEVFQVCGELQLPLVCHCEDAAMNASARERVMARYTPSTVPITLHSSARPPESEVSSIAFAISLSRVHGTHLHIAHVSTEGGMELVRQAKREGLHVTCEVAPHHLFLTEEDYTVLGTLAKVNPPLRSLEHRAALWRGIADRTVDCIASDHAPHTLEEKNLPPLQAPSGVPGVETMLPLLLSVAAGKWPHPQRDFPFSIFHFQYEDIVRLCFDNPNRIFSLGRSRDQTPSILIDPTEEWVITGRELHSKCHWTPYEGWKVVGKVKHIIPPSREG